MLYLAIVKINVEHIIAFVSCQQSTTFCSKFTDCFVS